MVSNATTVIITTHYIEEARQSDKVCECSLLLVLCAP